MTKFLPFYLDADEGYFGNQKSFAITSDTETLAYLTAFLNSSLFRCCFIDNFPNLGEDRRELSKIYFDKIPIKKPTAAEVSLFERLVPLIQFAKAQGQTAPAAFLEDLIDACVMESYFREHMAERDLLFHDTVAPHLAAYAPEASATQQRDFLTHLHQTLNAPSSPSATASSLPIAPTSSPSSKWRAKYESGFLHRSIRDQHERRTFR
jgi:hypothetical protein